MNTNYTFYEVKNKKGIIKETTKSKTFKPKDGLIELLLKRYNIWKDIYSTNNPLSQKLKIEI